MGVVKNLMVRAGADFSAISKQAKRASASMKSMQSGFQKSCSVMTSAASKMNRALSLIGVGLSVAGIAALSKSAKAAYDIQAEAETRLAQVMRNTIGASAAEIKSIKDLASAQQALGVIGDEVQLAGAQELATYVSMTSTLKTLIPVMNDMAAQQYGLGATAENTANIATMLGKVMSGQTSGLSRYGYYFTEAQEAVLKYGDEAQRAATLAEVVGESVGGMNAALAATPSGRLKQVSNTLGDIKESFGQAVTTIATVFLPGLNAVCSILANVATLANKVAQAVSNVFGGGGAKSAAAVVSYTAAASSAMDDLTESTKQAGAAAKKSLGTFSFDTLNKLSGTSSSASGSGSAAGGDDSGAGGLITETAGESEEAAESVGWLEKALERMKKTAAALNFEPLMNSLQRLKEAAAPLGETLFSGLKWAYDNVLEPLAHWTIEDALPAFLDMLAKSAEALNPALERLGEALKPLVKSAFDGLRWGYENLFIPLGTWAGTELLPAFLDVLAGGCDLLGKAVGALKPLGTWLWEKFLQPLASWTGGVIVDVLGKVADTLHKVADWISEHQTLVQNVAIVIGSFAAAWGLVHTALSIGAGVFTAVKTAAGLFGAAIGFLASPIGIAVAAIGGVIAVLVLLAKNWDTVKETAAKAVEGIQNAWNAVGDWFSSSVVEPLKTAWNNGMETVKTWASNAWTGVQNAWSAAGEWFRSTVAEPVKNAWNTGMESVKSLGSSAWAGVQNTWSAAKGWFSSTVAEPVKAAWSAGMESVKSLGSSAWEGVKTAWSGVSGWFQSNVTDPVSSGFKGLANAIIGFFEGFANGGIRGVNSILEALNRIHINIPDWVPGIGGSSWGFSLPTISSVRLPRLANGAVFEGNDPYLAIVNDQKHGVNVESPLSTIVEAMMIALRQSNFGGDVQVNVRAVFEGQLAALARYLRPYFEAEAVRVGGKASKGGV